MVSPTEYLELCDRAQCGPDSANIACPGDPSGQARWLSARLARYGHDVTPGECRQIADRFWQWSASTSGKVIGVMPL